MNYLYSIVIGYLLGSISPSYLISKAKGFDIREKGSGNAGASNMVVTLGWAYGIFTALFDIAKSFVAVKLCGYLFKDMEVCGRLAGIMAVLGHMFPFYMSFRGGKGYASYTGMTLAFNWKLAVCLMIWGTVVTLVTDYIALATISTVIICPLYYLITGANPFVLLLLTALGLVIVYKHKINIERIIRHEEIGLRKVNKNK